MRRYTAIVVLFTGCQVTGLPETDRSYIAPADGQSGVASTLSLLVRTGGVRMPPELEIPAMIEVVDLGSGGRVPGVVSIQGDALLFSPVDPWEDDHRYAWTVPSLRAWPHAPDVALPAHLEGTAVFDTSPALALLGASWDPSAGRACMVFSRPLTPEDEGALTITADDVPVRDSWIELTPVESWATPWPVLPADDGIDLLCIAPDAPITAETAIRVTWGTEGPWRVELEETSLGDVLGALRREPR